MITVTFRTENFECTTALKGTDYIHLLDENNLMVASFEGITDFTDFSIDGGSWTTPTPANECSLVTMGDDGVLHKTDYRCNEISNKSVAFTITLTSAGWSNKAQEISDSRFVTSGYAYTVTPASTSFTAYCEAGIYADDVSTTGKITFHCEDVPTSNITVNILKIQVS